MELKFQQRRISSNFTRKSMQMSSTTFRAGKLMSAIEGLNDACIGGDESLIKSAYETYDSVLYELNEGSSSIYGMKSIAMEALQTCASPPGVVPLWGQIGEFVMTVDGMSTLVRYHPQYHRWNAVHFEFLALDKFKPFISETGYKSLFLNNLKLDCSLQSSAQNAFIGLQQNRLSIPDRDYLPEWYEKPITLQDSSGQGAFNF